MVGQFVQCTRAPSLYSAQQASLRTPRLCPPWGCLVLHTQRSWKHEWQPHHRRVCPARTAFFAREVCARGAVACAPWKLPCSRAEASVISDSGFLPSSGAFKRFGPSAFLWVHVTPAGAPWTVSARPTWGRVGGRVAGGAGPGCGLRCEFLQLVFSARGPAPAHGRPSVARPGSQ